MSNQYCFVCASNEGVFLDVTPDNQDTFGDQIEACLSTKINENINLSNKICYKCAYELDQCTKFVRRYKNSHEVSEPNVQKTSMRCCFLCCELVESDRIFDISKDKSVFNPLRKIRSIFNDDVSKENNSTLICLTCRYNLDVLYDLKRIYQETLINLRALINEEINYSDLPKVHTDVVNRKTTITTFPDITFYGSINSDSDSNEEEDMARKRHVKGRKVQSAQTKSRSSKSKIRNCDKCHIAVASDIDMYRFYRTGLTVCKNCWITMDPSIAKSSSQRRSRQQFKTETKFCAVFLTDVLSKESTKKDTEKDETHETRKDETHETRKDETHETRKDETHKTKKNKTHEMKKDKDNDTSYDSSQEEAKSSDDVPSRNSPKTRNHIVNGKTKQGKKRKIDTEKSKSDVERTPMKVTRFNKERANTNEMKSSKASVDAEQQPSPPLTKTRGGKRIIDNKSSDSDGSQKQQTLVDAEQQSGTHLTKTRGRKRIISDKSSDSEDSQNQKETDRIKLNVNKTNKTQNKKQKTVLEGTSSNVRSDSSDETLDEEVSLKNRLENMTSSAIVKKEPDRNIRSRTRSSSSTEMTLTEFKNPKSLAQSEVKTEYTCDKCTKKFDTKLSSAKHKLTHFKQAALKLEKLTVPNIKQETELSSQDEISKKVTSGSSKTTSIDKRTDDPSEEIAINVEDDTDDEELFTLVTTKKAKKKVKKEKSDDDGDVIDKSCVATNESRLGEKSANDEDIKITESEKCENSKPDTVIEVKNEDRQDTDTKDEHMMDENRDCNESRDAQNTTAILKDHKNENDEQDKGIENDAEISFTEKENTISEYDDLYEEATSNDKRSSPLLLVHNKTKDNKSYTEDCKNNLENNCTVDEDQMIEESEIQSDLMAKSLKKHITEPEEKVPQILLQTDERETLNEKNDLNDIMVVNEAVEGLEEEQNKFNEENMEMIADIDKSNSARDMPDLLNGETHDAIGNNEIEDGEDDIAINSDDDGTKYKKVTEEMILTDHSKERKLEEELKELEDLVESNVMNKYEEHIQENSTYIPDNSSADAANEILKEVFELAAAEVQQREEITTTKTLDHDDVEMETLENISREIRKSADMPSLDPISVMDIDDDSIILN